MKVNTRFISAIVAAAVSVTVITQSVGTTRSPVDQAIQTSGIKTSAVKLPEANPYIRVKL